MLAQSIGAGMIVENRTSIRRRECNDQGTENKNKKVRDQGWLRHYYHSGNLSGIKTLLVRSNAHFWATLIVKLDLGRTLFALLKFMFSHRDMIAHSERLGHRRGLIFTHRSYKYFRSGFQVGLSDFLL